MKVADGAWLGSYRLKGLAAQGCEKSRVGAPNTACSRRLARPAAAVPRQATPTRRRGKTPVIR